MFDALKRRAGIIERLVAALGIANEIGDAITGYLIEQVLDEARAGQVLADTADQTVN
jgi:molybdate-binding protein